MAIWDLTGLRMLSDDTGKKECLSAVQMHGIGSTGKPRREQLSSTPLGNALVAAGCPNEL